MMARFRYEAWKDGERVVGTLIAPSLAEAEMLALQKGLLIDTLISKQGRKGVTSKDCLQFAQGMASLLKAGLPLKEAANLWMEDLKHPELWEQLFSRVFAGQSLAQGMKESGFFPPYVTAMIQIGESTGELRLAFEHAASYLEEKQRLRQTIVAALTYPAMVMVVAIVAVSILILYVMPVFEEMYSRFNAELPFLTQMLLSSVAFLKTYSVWLALVVAAMVLGFMQVSKSKAFHLWRDSTLLKIPVVSGLVNQYLNTMMCQSLGSCLKAGIGLLDSIYMLSNLIPNQYLQTALERVALAVGKGVPPSKAFEQEKLFDRRIRRMIKVGEESAELGTILSDLGQMEIERFQARLKSLTSLLEPFMIIGISLLIGILLIALYLPMFDVVQAMG